jgi:hypothetical protein
MNEFDPITPRQNDDAQKHRPCGNNTACLGTASPDSRGRSHDLKRHTGSSPFALSGSLRVQWVSTTLAQKIFTQDA